MTIIKYLLAVATLLACQSINAQSQKQIDSLIELVSKAKEDSNKVRMLNSIALMYRGKEPKKALKFGHEALSVAQGIDSKEGMAMATNTIGSVYKEIDQYPKSLEYLFRSLRLNEELKRDANVSNNLGNIGNVYRELHDYPKALEYTKKALELNRKLDKKIGITNNLSDLGIISAIMKDYTRAMDYFNEALKVSQESNDEEGSAIIYGNIANTYSEQKNVEKSVEYFLKALALNEKLGRKVGVATNLVNLGGMHLNIASDSINPAQYGGSIPASRDANLKKAEEYFTRSIAIYREISFLEGLLEAYKNLSEVYAARGDYKNALQFYSQAQTIKDSIFSVDNKVKLANLNAERAEHEKEQQIQMNELLETKRRNETLLLVGGIVLLLIITVFVIRERRKSDKLLLNILPAEVAAELKQKGASDAKYFDNVTVLFTDFVNFTDAGQRMTPQQLVDELHACFKVFDEIISKYKIEKIKTIGDAYLAVAGVPVADPDHASHVVHAAIEISDFIAKRKEFLAENAFEIRIGVHSGNVVAGIVGVKKFAYDIWGDTVNTAARMQESSEPGKINISQSTYELVNQKFQCTYRGKIEAKNKGELAMYFVEGEKS